MSAHTSKCNFRAGKLFEIKLYAKFGNVYLCSVSREGAVWSALSALGAVLGLALTFEYVCEPCG